jgi:hypothetical protein
VKETGVYPALWMRLVFYASAISNGHEDLFNNTAEVSLMNLLPVTFYFQVLQLAP